MRSWVETKADRSFERQEMDPLGAEVGAHDPYLYTPNPTYGDVHGGAPMYVEGGDPLDLRGGCEIDYMPALCSEAREKMENGSVNSEHLTSGREGWEHVRTPITSSGLGLVSISMRVLSQDNEGPGLRLGWQSFLFNFAPPPRPPETTQPERTRDACGEMAANAQRLANNALNASDGNAKKALSKFDNDFGKFYAGYPMNNGVNMARLRSSGGGGSNRQAPEFLMGQTGFKREFLETDSTGNLLGGHHDQTHHFAAMFSGGINRYWLETSLHNRGDNDGDQRLTNAAYGLGAALRKDPNKLRDIGHLIRSTICDQSRR